jgi:hypothetical protein
LGTIQYHDGSWFSKVHIKSTESSCFRTPALRYASNQTFYGKKSDLGREIAQIIGAEVINQNDLPFFSLPCKQSIRLDGPNRQLFPEVVSRFFQREEILKGQEL